MFCSNCGFNLNNKEMNLCPSCGETILLKTNIDEAEQKRMASFENPQEGFDEIKAMLNNTCRSYIGEYPRCYIDTPITDDKKYVPAIINYNIPSFFSIYILYDDTVTGSYKEGFALCENGIYYKQSASSGHISWENFLGFDLSFGMHGIQIGDLLFLSDPETGRTVLAILQKIQDLFINMSIQALDILFNKIKS